MRQKTPEFQNNGPTYGWTLEAMRITPTLLAPGNPESIGIPVRIYTAEKDGSVLPHEQELFAGRLPKGERILVRNARHEIYRSADEVLFPWWKDVLAFLRP